MMTPLERRNSIEPKYRCEVCCGEGVVSYIQSSGGFSEPADCYKCEGTGHKLAPPPQEDQRGGAA